MRKRILYLAPASALLFLAVPGLAESAGTASAPAIDLTPLFQAVIALLASIVTVKLVPWIKQRTTAEQQAKINLLIRTLVYAAEQIYRNEQKSGDQKLLYVKAKLMERGYDIDLDAIEAAVLAMRKDGNWLATQQPQ